MPAAVDDESDDFDPADQYKHIAIADCSKSFSNQEVSKIQSTFSLYLNFIYIIISVFWYLISNKPSLI